MWVSNADRAHATFMMVTKSGRIQGHMKRRYGYTEIFSLDGKAYAIYTSRRTRRSYAFCLGDWFEWCQNARRRQFKQGAGQFFGFWWAIPPKQEVVACG